MSAQDDVGRHLSQAVEDATAAQAQWRNGDLQQAFRLVVRARVQLAAAQGTLNRLAREEIEFMRAPSPVTQRERGGAPA
jgi:hypothetical protein